MTQALCFCLKSKEQLSCLTGFSGYKDCSAFAWERNDSRKRRNCFLATGNTWINIERWCCLRLWIQLQENFGRLWSWSAQAEMQFVVLPAQLHLPLALVYHLMCHAKSQIQCKEDLGRTGKFLLEILENSVHGGLKQCAKASSWGPNLA